MNSKLTSLVLVDVMESQLEMLSECSLTHKEKNGALKLLMLECENLSLKISDEQYVEKRRLEGVLENIKRTTNYIDAIKNKFEKILELEGTGNDVTGEEYIGMFVENLKEIHNMLNTINYRSREILPF